jgi:hypothetical protein
VGIKKKSTCPNSVSSTQVLDSIFEETGHETITLPLYHCNTTNLEHCENQRSTKNVKVSLKLEIWKNAVSQINKIKADY